MAQVAPEPQPTEEVELGGVPAQSTRPKNENKMVYKVQGHGVAQCHLSSVNVTSLTHPSQIMPPRIRSFALRGHLKAVCTICLCALLLLLAAAAAAVVLSGWQACENAAFVKSNILSNGTVPLMIPSLDVGSTNLFKAVVVVEPPPTDALGLPIQVEMKARAVDQVGLTAISGTVGKNNANAGWTVHATSTDTAQHFWNCYSTDTKIVVPRGNPTLNVTTTGGAVFFNGTNPLYIWPFEFGAVRHIGESGSFRSKGLTAGTLLGTLSTGSFDVGGRFGHIDLHTSTGSISLGDISTDRTLGLAQIKLKAETGSIRILKLQSDDSHVIAHTDTGSIEIQVPDTFKGTYTMTIEVGSASKEGKTISTPQTASTASGGTVSTGSIGGGGAGQLVLTTDTGSIKITQPTKA